MKKTIITGSIFLMLFVAACSSLNKTSKSDIQVLPLGGEVRVTDGSIVYALPMTVFEIDVTAERTIEIPGPYANYASELLGLDNIIKAESETWDIVAIDLKTTEELDPSQFYVIEGTSLMQTNALALKSSGLVLDLSPSVYSTRSFSNGHAGSGYKELMFPDLGADEYVSMKTDTAFKLVKADTSFIRVPYLVEKKRKPSVAEVAASAAKKLLELREGKHLLLIGETNVFPQGSAAIEEINRLDREYTALFAGKSWTEAVHYKIWFTPQLSQAGEPQVLFNFSDVEGFKTAGNNRGIPVMIDMTPTGKTRDLNLVVRPVVSKKEIGMNDKLYYRVPDVADIRITKNDEGLCTARKIVYQFGNTVTLPSNFIIGK